MLLFLSKELLDNDIEFPDKLLRRDPNPSGANKNSPIDDKLKAKKGAQKLRSINIDCREPKYHMTPMMIASLKGSRDIVLYLAKYGANVKLKDSRGNTALQLACMKQRFHVIDALLQNGANPNEVNENGWNCLTTAVNYFHENNASMLLLLLQVREIQLSRFLLATWLPCWW